MLAPVAKEKWDVESICSTYSNTDNHPRVISSVRFDKKQGKIVLSKKTGIPLGYHPAGGTGRGARPSAIEEEEDEEEDGEGDEGDEGGAGENLGERRDKKESKEEKRLRKAAVKAARREKRATKKDLKVALIIITPNYPL